MARPGQRPRAVEPWPFVGMIGLVAMFFPYAASGLVAPWWGVALLVTVWVALFVLACRWWTPHPRRLVGLAAVSPLLLFAVVAAGGAWWGWSA